MPWSRWWGVGADAEAHGEARVPGPRTTIRSRPLRSVSARASRGYGPRLPLGNSAGHELRRVQRRAAGKRAAGRARLRDRDEGVAAACPSRLTILLSPA